MKGEHLEQKMQELLAEKSVSNLMIRIGCGEEILGDFVAAEGKAPDQYTLFDMASVTKIVVTTTLLLMTIDEGKISLTDTVGQYFKASENRKNITIHQLMTHTWGVGYNYLNTEEYSYGNIDEYILKIPQTAEPGSMVQYSCPGFVLLGKILEGIYGKDLNTMFAERVAKPLQMTHSGYLPEDTNSITSNIDGKIAVNDHNCRNLGGIAGNAGLFSCLSDMTRFVGMLRQEGAPLISKGLFKEACRNQTENLNAARGLGYLYVDEKYEQTGKLFPIGSIGHCGHTGQSVFLDRNSGLYVIILSDATLCSQKKHGFVRYDEVMRMRADLHNAIWEDLPE